MHIFDIDHIFVEIWGYPLSYLEFLGGLSSLIYVVLAARESIWNWPLVLVSTTLTFLVFYQVQLYPDMLLQVFFFLTGVVGWWRWSHPKPTEANQKNELRVGRMNMMEISFFLVIGLSGTYLMGLFAQHLHEMLPQLFSKPSARPYLDSFITVMSVTTTYFVIQKKLESWISWIIIDLVATYLYYVRDIKFYSFNYLLFCLLAAYGFYTWLRIYQKNRTADKTTF